MIPGEKDQPTAFGRQPRRGVEVVSAMTRKMSPGAGVRTDRSIRDDSFAGGIANVVVVNDAIDQTSTGRDWGRNDHHGHEADIFKRSEPVGFGPVAVE